MSTGLIICVILALTSTGVLAGDANNSLRMKLLSERGSTRATRYSNANKIVTLGTKTHIAWLDSVSRTMIATFDHESQQWSRSVHVGSGQDNHGGPALTCDSRGYLHIVFGPHASVPFQHRRSARPNDATEWIELKTFGTHPTYPSVVCDSDDTLHIIYRGGPQPRQPFSMLYQRKPREGEWTEPVVLARCPSDWKGYTHYHQSLTIDRAGSLHIAFNLYYNGRALDVGYVKSTDRGRSWLRPDGQSALLPVTTESEAILFHSKNPLKVVSAVCDRTGTPWIAVNEQKRYSIRRYEGGTWRVINANDSLTPEQRSADLSWGAFTIADDGRLLIPVVVGKGVTGGVVGDLWLLVSDVQKRQFQRFHIAQPDKTQPHTGASLERFTGHNSVAVPWLLFSTGPKGPDNFGKGLHHRVHAVFRSE